jgi:hypothetical protein
MKEVAALPPPPGTPGPFSLADTYMQPEKFRQAGFRDVSVHIENMNFKAASAEQFTAFHQAINAPVKMMIASQTPERQSGIWNAITNASRRYADATGAITLQNELIYIAAKA